MVVKTCAWKGLIYWPKVVDMCGISFWPWLAEISNTICYLSSPLSQSNLPPPADMSAHTHEFTFDPVLMQILGKFGPWLTKVTTYLILLAKSSWQFDHCKRRQGKTINYVVIRIYGKYWLIQICAVDFCYSFPCWVSICLLRSQNSGWSDRAANNFWWQMNKIFIARVYCSQLSQSWLATHIIYNTWVVDH